MLEVKSVNEVYDILEREFADICPESETVDICSACGRILAQDVLSHEDIPAFHRSSVDGYAVCAADTFGAGEAAPAQLSFSGEIRMGEKPAFPLERGHTVYIPTGGELPEGADAVVMVEYSEDLGDGYIYLGKAAAPGNNMVFKGDDIRAGARVFPRGKRLRPQDIGVLAALGVTSVPVKKRIRVGILSTGDEVVDIHESPAGAQVRDINSYSLYAGLLAYGAEPVLYGIIRDRFECMRETALKAAGECDVVLISGGSSVGSRDETLRVIASLGEPGVLVHGIAVKPGKPTILARIGNKAVFGLPGHPASAYFIFHLFVLRLLDRVNRVNEPKHYPIPARMSKNYPSNHGREEYVPVRLTHDGTCAVASPVFGKSGLITLLSSADGYVRVERGTEGLKAGATVEVIPFGRYGGGGI